MDLLLEQPLDAVDFRDYFLPEVAGAVAWTCLAAVLAAAAAAGLWRLRCSTAHAAKPLDLEHRSALKIRESDTWNTPETSALPESISSSVPALVTTRERYTAYYQYDGGCVGCCGVEGENEDDREGYHHHQDQEDLEDDEDVVYGTAPSEPGPFDWQQVAMFLPLGATRTTTTVSQTGRCRSLRTVVGTSVVQLWDQGAEGGLTAASPRRRRGVVVRAGIGSVSL